MYVDVISKTRRWIAIGIGIDRYWGGPRRGPVDSVGRVWGVVDGSLYISSFYYPVFFFSVILISLSYTSASS